MPARSSASKPAAPPKPLPQAQTYGRAQATQKHIRMGVLAGILAFMLIPRLPSPIGPIPNPLGGLPGLPEALGPWDWKAQGWVYLSTSLGQRFTGPGSVFEGTVPDWVPTIYLLDILHWGLAIFLLIVIMGIVQHLVSWYRQRRAGIAQQPTYVTFRIPGTAKITPLDGVKLLGTLHGMLPAGSLMRGDPAPVALRWISLPEQPVEQGVSILGPKTLTTAIQKRLNGVAGGAVADIRPDPFLEELTEGRVLCWRDVVLRGGDTLPIAVADRSEDGFLDSLLPSMLPQQGVIVADMQITLRPLADRSWRVKVLSQLEAMKIDASSGEKKAAEAKANGPAFHAAIRLRCIAEDADSGAAQLDTMAAALSATAQSMADREQRLQAGSPQALPAVMPPPAPFSAALRRATLIAGGSLALAAAALLWFWQLPWTAFLAVPLIVPIPLLSMAHRHRNQTNADARLRHKQALAGTLAPANPKVVPLWSEMLPPKGGPLLLSTAELATLWHPPTPAQESQVQRVAARWLPAPANAFIDTGDPKNIAMGLGRKSDGSMAKVGMSYDKLRYIGWITAPMGRGKSEWLRNMISGLFAADAGFMALDCKAQDLVNTTLPLIPIHREKDITLINLEGTNVTGEDSRVMMNLLSPTLGRSLGVEPSMMASTVLGIFATLDPRFNEAVGIQQFANMGMLALLGGERAPTLMHLMRFFADDDYRAEVCGNLDDSFLQTRNFWERRFPDMPEGQKSSLASFERRLDRLLSYPELQAMLVAPGCSVDLRRAMDNKGIVLMGVSASQGQIATVAITLLLTQLLLAALSRTNVPEKQRPDWPLIVDEVQIIANSNEDLFKVMLSQFRSMRIGQVYVHQGLSQIGPGVMGPLADNAGTRVILGCEAPDAGTYASQYGSLGLRREDFTGMEVHPKYGFALHQYTKLFGAGNLFSSQPLPMAQALDEPAPPPVYEDWHLVTAPARSEQDRKIDDLILRFREEVARDRQMAVKRLGKSALQRPDVFDAYCARTKAHRQAQRAFILRNPGCIRPDPDIADEQARTRDQKLRRIKILSALENNVPRLETEALAYALLVAADNAAQAKKEREEEEKAAKAAAKKGGGGKGKSSGKASASASVPLSPPASAVPVGAGTGASAPQTMHDLPDLDELRARRRERLEQRAPTSPNDPAEDLSDW